jgi:hypothetical protein
VRRLTFIRLTRPSSTISPSARPSTLPPVRPLQQQHTLPPDTYASPPLTPCLPPPLVGSRTSCMRPRPSSPATLTRWQIFSPILSWSCSSLGTGFLLERAVSNGTSAARQDAIQSSKLAVQTYARRGGTFINDVGLCVSTAFSPALRHSLPSSARRQLCCVYPEKLDTTNPGTRDRIHSKGAVLRAVLSFVPWHLALAFAQARANISQVCSLNDLLRVHHDDRARFLKKRSFFSLFVATNTELTVVQAIRPRSANISYFTRNSCSQEASPTPQLHEALIRACTLYGAGMGFSSLSVLTAVARATVWERKVTWRLHSPKSMPTWVRLSRCAFSVC